MAQAAARMTKKTGGQKSRRTVPLNPVVKKLYDVRGIVKFKHKVDN